MESDNCLETHDLTKHFQTTVPTLLAPMSTVEFAEFGAASHTMALNLIHGSTLKFDVNLSRNEVHVTL